MIVNLASIAVRAFGAVIALLCLWGMLSPRGLIGLAKRVAQNSAGLGLAVGVRVILGAALLTAAQVSSFPRSFTVLGWVAILAAIGLLIMGRSGMSRVIGWATRLSPKMVRVWLVLGLLFGAFLIFGA